MIKIIYGIALMVFLMVVGASIINAAQPAKSEIFKQFENIQKADQPQLRSENGTFKVTSEAPAKKMKMAIDLRIAKAKIQDSIIDHSHAFDAIDYLEGLSFQFQNTPEGDRLLELLDDETAKLEDFLAAIKEIEFSLTTKLTGEEFWAFKVGLCGFDAMEGVYFGNESDALIALRNLQILAIEAPQYISPKEANLLKRVADHGYKSVLTPEDYLDIEADLGYFFEYYLSNNF